MPAEVQGHADQQLCKRQLKAGATQPAGSGHSTCRKAQFAGTLASIYIGMSLSGVAKDIYLEKLGAHPIAMGVIFFVVSVWAALNEVISGRLQEMEALRRWFPVETWGRKAPWLFTHTFVLALAVGMLFIPPTNYIILHAWFFVASVLLFWAMSTSLIAFESARQEIYPYNEERSQVEVFCKLGCIVGIGYSSLPLLILAAQASFFIRAVSSALFVVGVLVFGLQAKPVWLEAKSCNDHGRRKTSPMSDFRDCWKNVAFRYLLAVRFFDGLYQGLQATNLLYYLTYILQLHGFERSGWVMLVGSCNVVADVSTAVLVGRLMGERRNSFRIQGWVMWMRMLNIVLTVVLLAVPVVLDGAGPFDKESSALSFSRLVFLVWTTFNRVCQSPFSIWRVGAQCWIVDEDIHGADGARREAAFIGVASAAQNFARAVAAAIVFLGYGIVGLQPLNCEALCDTEGLVDECVDECMTRSILSQPDTLRWYVRLLFIAGLTMCEVLIVHFTRKFPIKGIRLAKLYNNQALAQGEQIDSGAACDQMLKLRLEVLPTLRDVAGALPGRSIAVMDDDASASVAHIERMLARDKKSGKQQVSASVVFGPLLDSLREGGMPAPVARSEVKLTTPLEIEPLRLGRPSEITVPQEHCTSPTPAFPVEMGRCGPYLQPWSLLRRGPCGPSRFQLFCCGAAPCESPK
mmetsp:Transcript_51898/g.151120  ORF Transcript_51898/g.151120 Transcript_51898/m.151120 type:complete len:689 (+) Transcript_51898:122-2188(+)